MDASATIQTNPGYMPLGSYTNPTGVEFTDGRSTIARYLFKVRAATPCRGTSRPRATSTGCDGANRTLTVNGVRTAYGGISATTGAADDHLVRNSPQLTFQPTGTTQVGSDEVARPGCTEGVHVPRRQEPAEVHVRRVQRVQRQHDHELTRATASRARTSTRRPASSRRGCSVSERSSSSEGRPPRTLVDSFRRAASGRGPGLRARVRVSCVADPVGNGRAALFVRLLHARKVQQSEQACVDIQSRRRSAPKEKVKAERDYEHAEREPQVWPRDAIRDERPQTAVPTAHAFDALPDTSIWPYRWPRVRPRR